MMEDILKEFSKTSSRKYMIRDDVPNYAYAAGYYESVIMAMYNRLSKTDQEFFMKHMQSGLTNLQGE